MNRPAPRHDDTVSGLNERVAVAITRSVGTMGTAYIFALTALVSLPSVLVTAAIVPADTFPAWTVAPGLTGLVLWVSATFIQLVLLPIIMVGQNLAARAGDARAQATSDHVDAILAKLETMGTVGISTPAS